MSKRKHDGEKILEGSVKRYKGASSSSSSTPSPNPSAPSAAALLFQQLQTLSPEQQQEFLQLQQQAISQSASSSSSQADMKEDIPHSPARGKGLKRPITPESPGTDTSDASVRTRIKRDLKTEVSKAVITELGQDSILFRIEGRNVSTNVSGKSDGNHITALVILKEIVYNFVQGKEYEEMRKALPDLLESIGLEKVKAQAKPEEESKGESTIGVQGKILRFLEEREKLLKDRNLTPNRDNRKKLTKDLRQRLAIAEALQGKDLAKIVQDLGLDRKNTKRFTELFNVETALKEADIDNAKELMKYGERAVNASTIAAINLTIIKALNQQIDPPSAVKNRNPNGCHDRDEDGAVRNIKLFIITNELTKRYSIEADVDNRTALLADFKEKAAEIMGFDDSTKEERFGIKFNKFMKEFISVGEENEWVTEMREKIDQIATQDIKGKGSQKKLTKLSKIKGSLDSYNENEIDIEVLKSKLREALGADNIKNIIDNFDGFVEPLPKKQIEEQKDRGKQDSVVDDQWVRNIAEKLGANQKTITKNIGKAFNELFDFGYVAHNDKDDIDIDIETLYKVSARHISYMFNAFGKLKELPQETRNRIVDSFFDHVASNTDGKDQGWNQVLIEGREGEKSLEGSVIKSKAGQFISNFTENTYRLDLNPKGSNQEEQLNR